MIHNVLRTVTVLVIAALVWTFPNISPCDSGSAIGNDASISMRDSETTRDEVLTYTEDDISGYVDDLMGLSAFYYQTETDFGHKDRIYMFNKATVLAESWGFEIDDYIFDFNDDSLTDIICNTVCGGDGHRECYVYTVDQVLVRKGMVDRSAFPDFDNWGANAMETWYDAGEGKVCVFYSSTEQEEPKTVYVNLDELTYREWNMDW